MKKLWFVPILLTIIHTNLSFADATNGPVYADGHAPIGVMGDHRHKLGEWMFSYRYMEMSMKDNLQGKNNIDPDTIVTTIANPYANPAEGRPMTVRVVPLEMTTKMHMFGAMYAPSNEITLMLMLNYLEKEMDLLTYMGGMGTTQLGTFKTESSGFGDLKISALYKLYDSKGHKVHLNAGLSIPTGSIDEDGTVLTPMGMQMDMRLPYSMQLGSGTYDLLPGITYYAGKEKLGWGTQVSAIIRLGENEEDYTLGDQYQISSWASYRVIPSTSTSLRITYQDTDSIDGFDDQIMAPVQTANPSNYGGNALHSAIGINYAVQQGGLRGLRLALEYSVPLKQKVNGVQMEMQDMLTLGLQYAISH